MKKKGSVVFFVVLIVSVLITILLIVLFAKNDLKEVEHTKEQIATGEEMAKDLEEGVNQMNNLEEQRFDNLDNELENMIDY